MSNLDLIFFRRRCGRTCPRERHVSSLMRRHDGDGITLVVADDGVGLPQNLDFRNAESVGLQLLVSLVEQLRGTITFDRDTGTRFTVEFAEPRGMGVADGSQEPFEHVAT